MKDRVHELGTTFQIQMQEAKTHSIWYIGQETNVPMALSLMEASKTSIENAHIVMDQNIYELREESCVLYTSVSLELCIVPVWSLISILPHKEIFSVEELLFNKQDRPVSITFLLSALLGCFTSVHHQRVCWIESLITTKVSYLTMTITNQQDQQRY